MKNYTYIRKPETIQAIQAFRDNQHELAILAPGIWTPTVGIGKWLIKHEDGSLSVMTEEEFEKNYIRDESFHIFGDE